MMHSFLSPENYLSYKKNATGTPPPYSTGATHQQVFRLQVAVDDVLRMKEGEGLGQVGDHVGRVTLRELDALSDGVEQIAALCKTQRFNSKRLPRDPCALPLILSMIGCSIWKKQTFVEYFRELERVVVKLAKV